MDGCWLETLSQTSIFVFSNPENATSQLTLPSQYFLSELGTTFLGDGFYVEYPTRKKK